MKIKVIMTGGTVGSEKNGGVIFNKPEKDIADIWQSKNNSDIEFIKAFPYSVLSENISIENWQLLLNELNYDNNGLDGIIITHGSDTLSYTSAMASIFCKDTTIPVVLTGSDKVLTDETANGLPNFTKAVELIKENACGVWTVFDKVFPACEVTEADCFSDKFSSGKSTEDNIEVSRDIKFQKRVLMLKEYPFADYSGIVLDDTIGAVVLVCYHSGTANENSVLRLIQKCRQKGIKIYLQGLKSGGGMYSSTDTLIKNGAVPLFDMTAEYAFARTMFLINQ